MKFRSRYLLILFSFFLLFLLLRFFTRLRQQNIVVGNSKRISDIHSSMLRNSVSGEQYHAHTQCSMGNCFDWNKCKGNLLKVYVYPQTLGSSTSVIYEKILKALRESYLFTNDPNEACLFVLAVDTTDRDSISFSENYVKDINDQIRKLPQDIWMDGLNHLIFNIYFGTYPNYEYNLGFDAGKAMIACASANSQFFRFGFDVSFPLFHKEHPFRTIPKAIDLQSLRRDKYTATFKGKRYVFGIGSDTRNVLYKLHDNDTFVIATTCKHTEFWKKFEDDRCSIDNENYDRWDYVDLLNNSTFCFTPRGRRLGSFRFLEALGAGCIPVVLSDEWILPLSEIIDWSRAAIIWHESDILFTSDYLLGLSDEAVFELKLQSILLYHRYFSSIEHIVLSSIESVLDRVRRQNAMNGLINWNSLLDIEKFVISKKHFTIVLQAILRESTRLKRIILDLSKLKHLKKVVVLWPKDRGIIPKLSDFQVDVELEFIEVVRVDQSEFLRLNVDSIESDLIFFLDERIAYNAQELEKAVKLVERNPTKFLTFQASQYSNSENGFQWSLFNSDVSAYSFGWLYQAVIHKYFIKNYQRLHLWKEANFASWFTPYCHIAMFNVMYADMTLNSPFLVKGVTNNSLTFANVNHNVTTCFSQIMTQMYDNNVSLISSEIRYIL